MKATFLALKGNEVLVKREDGVEQTIFTYDLSQPDRNYVFTETLDEAQRKRNQKDQKDQKE